MRKFKNDQPMWAFDITQMSQKVFFSHLSYIVNIFYKTELLNITDVWYDEGENSGLKFVKIPDSECFIKELEKEKGLFSKSSSFMLEGKSRIYTESGDFFWSNEYEIITLDCNLNYFGIWTYYDIWTPVDYDDQWQVVSSMKNSKRLKQALQEIEKRLNMTSDMYNEVQMVSRWYQYGYDLYEQPIVLNDMPQLDENLSAIFDLNKYLEQCSRIEDMYKSNSRKRI